MRSFFSTHSLSSYQKNETIVRAEDPPQYIYYIKKGFVRQYALSIDGEDLTLNIFKPHSYFYIAWAFGIIDTPYFFEALTPVEVWKAPRRAVMRYLNDHADELRDLTYRVLRGLTATLWRMESLAFGNARQKVAAVLVMATRRFGVKTGKEYLLPVPLTHRIIASMAGMARETISVEMSALKTEGLIGLRSRRLVIRQLAKLEFEAGLSGRAVVRE